MVNYISRNKHPYFSITLIRKILSFTTLSILLTACNQIQSGFSNQNSSTTLSSSTISNFSIVKNKASTDTEVSGVINKVIIDSDKTSRHEYYFSNKVKNILKRLTSEDILKYQLHKVSTPVDVTMQISRNTSQTKKESTTNNSNSTDKAFDSNFEIKNIKFNTASKSLKNTINLMTNPQTFKTAFVFMNYKNISSKMSSTIFKSTELNHLKEIFSQGTWGGITIDTQLEKDIYINNINANFIDDCENYSSLYAQAESFIASKNSSTVYNRIVVVSPEPVGSTCDWIGIAYVTPVSDRKPSMIVVRSDNVTTMAHELGHSFGLNHSGLDSDHDGLIDYYDYNYYNYEDYSCVMGNGGNGIFNASKLFEFNLINNTQGTKALSDGTLNLVTIDDLPRPTIGPSAYTHNDYIISLRTPSQKSSYTASLLPDDYVGVNIHIKVNSETLINQYDMSSAITAVLKKGDIWHDPIKPETTIQVIDIDLVKGTAQIKVQGSKNTICLSGTSRCRIYSDYVLAQESSSTAVNYYNSKESNSTFQLSRWQNKSINNEKIKLKFTPSDSNINKTASLYAVAVAPNGHFYQKATPHATSWFDLGLGSLYTAENLINTILFTPFYEGPLLPSSELVLYDGPIIKDSFTIYGGYLGSDNGFYYNKKGLLLK